MGKSTILMTVRQPSQRIFQRDRQVLAHLLTIADNNGMLTTSTYAIARELGMHRQTLSRILQRLAKASGVVLADHSCTPIRVTKTLQRPVTEPVTQNVTEVTPSVTEVTPSVTETVTHTVTEVTLHKTDESTVATGATILWTVTCTLPHTPMYVTVNTETVTLSSQNVTESPQIVTLSADIVTQTVTDKKETKQKNEEIPPAPPKEEKKQKKEKNSPTIACAREEIATKTDEERLELRRQRFVDALLPFAARYGQETITQFAEYWTEPNRSNTRMRFELQRTWNTSLRLARWARNDYAFSTPNPNSYNHDNSYNTRRRPTSEDYIRAAQERAIAETEQFIREAELRRGGVPPHLPIF